MRHLEWGLLRRRLNGAAAPRDVPWWKTALNSSYAPLIAAAVGYAVAVMTEGRQQETYEKRLYLEQRMKLFVSTASDFTSYLENWERLNTITRNAVANKRPLTAEEVQRRDRYEKDRTAARERLWTDLEQARLFFDAGVGAKIAAFEQYFERHKNATLDSLPPKAEYERYKDAVLTAMRDEVKGGPK